MSFLPAVGSAGDCDLDELPLASPSDSNSSFHEFSFSDPPSPSDQACLSPSLVTDLDCAGLVSSTYLFVRKRTLLVIYVVPVPI